VTKSSSSRAAYVVLLLLVSIVSYVFSNWAYEWLAKVPVMQACPADSTCYGALAVYRITFGLVVFHLAHALIMVGVKDSTDVRASLQDGWFPLKLLALAGITVGAFFIPNSFFVYYGWAAVFGAGIFVIIQLLLLIEFAYSWNESWVRNMEDDIAEGHSGNSWFWGLLVSTFLMFGGAIALSGVMYKFFCTGDGCGLNTFFVTINLIVTIFLCALSLVPAVRQARPSSGILQSSVVMLYTSYLVWSAMLSQPSSTCNPLSQSGSSKGINMSIIIGAIFTIISVCYSTIRASGSSGKLGIGEQDTPEAKPLLVSEESAGGDGDEKEVVDDEVEQVAYNYSFFHLTFALGAMYICMLLTNWMTLSRDESTVNVDTGMVSVWVKIVSGWITLLLYLWTLAAPVLLPNREWN